MRIFSLSIWALLLVAPVSCQQSKWVDPISSGSGIGWFTLLESESEVRSRLGQPAMIADFGVYRSWQYRFGDEFDHDEFSHTLVFRRSDGKLVSISRNYSQERTVDEFFPAGQTEVYSLRQAGQAEYSIRLRRLPNEAILMAMGVSAAGQKTGQLVLMHRQVLANFYPWLAEQLDSADTPVRKQAVSRPNR